MRIRFRQEAAFRLLVCLCVLTIANSIALVWCLFVYMPSRAQADRDMAQLLRDTQQLLRAIK